MRQPSPSLPWGQENHYTFSTSSSFTSFIPTTLYLIIAANIIMCVSTVILG